MKAMLGLFILSWELTIIALCVTPSLIVIFCAFALVALWTLVAKNEIDARERDKEILLKVIANAQESSDEAGLVGMVGSSM